MRIASLICALCLASQAAQAERAASTNRTIGVCHLIDNPGNPLSGVNAVGPREVAWDFLRQNERPAPTGTIDDAVKAAKVSILQGPKHGELKPEEGVDYRYHPAAGYFGEDRVTFLVEIAGYKVKILLFLKVGTGSWGGTDGYDPYEDKKNCPQGGIWKIAQRDAQQQVPADVPASRGRG